MAKSASVYARIDPQLKEDAEQILSALGIPAAGAITMFYKQIILRRGLPFTVTLPEKPVGAQALSAEALDDALAAALQQADAGRTVPAEEAFRSVRESLQP